MRGSTPDHPSTTVLVCCYTLDRWHDLSAAIDSALTQDPAPDEVIVVVDHNDELLDRLRAERPSLSVVPNAGSQGLSGARNTGLKLAIGEVVIFLDDDAAACPDWLAGHLAPYQDPQVLGVGGRLDPLWATGRPGWFPRDFDWVVGCTHTGVPAVPAVIRNPIGANMSFRTDAILSAGGFSEQLGRVGTQPSGCEETEASIRVAQQNPGCRVMYAPDAVVQHRVPDERRRWAYFRRRCYAEGWSKATVRLLSAEPLATERDYATRILPRSLVRAVRAAIRGDRDALARAGAIVAGLGLTTIGYAAGRIDQRVHRS